MKVLIFGKNIVRKDLVNKLLGKKIEVKVFGRHVLENVTKIDGLELFPGSIFAELDIRSALKDVDVVISVIDASNDGTDVTLSLGMKKIAGEMESTNTRRIIALAGPGLWDINENDTTMLFETEGFPVQNKIAAHEQLAAFETLKKSSLNWTLVCPYSIIQGAATGHYNISANYAAYGQNRITTGDLADFIVNELVYHNYTKSKICITN